jgi:hypothetical protein
MQKKAIPSLNWSGQLISRYSLLRNAQGTRVRYIINFFEGFMPRPKRNHQLSASKNQSDLGPLGVKFPLFNP